MKVVRTLANVTTCEPVAHATLLIGLQSAEMIWKVEPGQFVMLGPFVSDLFEPFLNRPFSIHRYPGHGALELLVGVVGRATRLIESMSPGRDLWLLGPLGRGFHIPEGSRKVILVAGGLGVAPMFCLAESLCEQGKQVSLLYGAKSSDFLVPTVRLEKLGVEVRLATDDGSAGFHGPVSGLLSACLGHFSEASLRSTHLAACGPFAMLEAVNVQRIRLGLRLEVSLESRMACGLGACLGCSVWLADGRMSRVCCDGPVLDAEEVFG